MEALIPGEDGAMSAPRKYPQALRDRALRLVFEIRQQTGGQPGAIVRVANQLGVIVRRCATGFTRPRSTPASGPGCPPPNSTPSPSWNARSADCAAPMRSSRRRARCLGPSSTVPGRGDPDDRCAPGALGGRADLPGPGGPDQHRLRPHPAPASARTRRDARLKAEIERIGKADFEVEGAGKLWRQLQREASGWPAAPSSG